MYDAARKFVVLKNLKISVRESKSMDTFEDNVLKVQYVELTREPDIVTEEKLKKEVKTIYVAENVRRIFFSFFILIFITIQQYPENNLRLFLG